MSAGIVYVLVNEAFDNYVKIGKTINLEQRLRQLDNISFPLPFRCVYAVSVEDMDTVEKLAHNAFADQRVRNNREFFEIDAQRVISALKLTGGEDVTPKEDIVENNEEKQALDEARKLRVKFNFKMLDINPGEILKFKKDNSITCEVYDDTQVKFRDKITSLSNSADIVLKDMGYDWTSVQGPRWWVFEGKTLSELRNERENI